jgi:hypothetical protein
LGRTLLSRMIIPGTNEQTPEPTREGVTTGNPGNARVLTREGDATDGGLDNTIAPELYKPKAEPEAEAATTRSGRTIKPPERLIEEIGAMAAAGATAAANYEILLTAAEFNYYAAKKEMGEHAGKIALNGAGPGGGFKNTNKLHVMKYKQAINGKDKDQWEVAVKEEHDRMVKHKVWEGVICEDVPAIRRSYHQPGR